MLGIIGKGFVGTALGQLLEIEYDVVYYDKYKECNDPNVLKHCDIVFICVPTPMQNNGKIDLTILNECLDTCKDYLKFAVIKSTIVPGTIENLKYDFDIAFNPEFLRQDFANEDMKNSDRIILGTKNNNDFEKLKTIYKKVLPKAKYVNLTIKEAEMVKYAANVTLASQIGIANEIYNICDVLDINYNKIKETILLDTRIGNNINVPGPDGKFGFGGACFPKDLNALIYKSRNAGYTPSVLISILNSNKRRRI